MTSFGILLALDLAGLLGIFLYVRARLRAALEIERLTDGVHREVGALIAELNAVADRNVSLVEDRAESLRLLLAEAERGIVALRREAEVRGSERAILERIDAKAPLPERPDAPKPGAYDPLAAYRSQTRRVESRAEAPIRVEPASFAEARSDEAPRAEAPRAERLREEARTEAKPAQERTGAREGELPFVSFSSAPIRPRADFREEAVSLWRKGFSSDLIAARLGATIAEVDLVVSLEEGRTRREADT